MKHSPHPTQDDQLIAEWLERYRAASLRLAVDELSMIFAKDAVVAVSPLDDPVVGRPAIHRAFKEAFTGVNFKSLEFHISVVDGLRASAEWWCVFEQDDTPITEPGALFLQLNEVGLSIVLRMYPIFGDGANGKPAGWPHGERGS